MLWNRVRVLLGVAAAMLTLGVAGCGGGGGGGGLGVAPASVRGTVLDETSTQPIRGARVRSGGRSALTRADGTFTLGVELGPITVSVSAENYYTGTFTATTTTGEQVDMGTLTISSSIGTPPPPPSF
jgi:hypothetical protein